MSYKCPECGHTKGFRGFYSVLLDMDGEGVPDADSFDISHVEFDSSYIMICGNSDCLHSDTAAHFEPD